MKYEDTSTIDQKQTNDGKKHENRNNGKQQKNRTLISALGGYTFWWFIPIPIANDFCNESQLLLDY